jgi:hypothetical protein
MFADTGFFFPYLHWNLSPDVQQLEEYCKSQKPIAFSLDNNMVQASTIMEYDLGGEGDLFKAPEPIIEQQTVALDPMTAAIAMIHCAEDSITSQGLKAAEIELIQNDHILSEVLYECEKNLMATSSMDAALSDILDVKIPFMRIDDNNQIDQEQKPLAGTDLLFQKSMSSGCLTSMEEWVHGVGSSFLDFPGMDFGSVYGMRRAFSEGDIKTLNVPLEQHPLFIGNSIREARNEKLSRYRNKKTKRNFGRKIKYACRKALADSQPRIRGRFAKTEDSSDTTCKGQ